MLTTFIRWFQAPIFPKDEDKTRSALLLNVVLNTFLFALPVLFAGVILGGKIPRFEKTLIILACAWLTIFGTRLLMLAGRVAPAGTLMIIIIFIATTLAVYNLGTIRAPASSFYILAIVMSGLVVNHRAIVWMAGLSAITIITLLLAEINGLLPQPTLTVTITQGITFTVAFAIISILLYLAVKSIDEALTRARQELAERQRTEEKLRTSEERFRAMIENISDAIALVDATATVKYISPAAERILGYSSTERLGSSSFANLATPEDALVLQHTFEKLQAEPRKKHSFRVQARHKDGSLRWIEATATNLLDLPSVQAIVVNYRDITERIHAEDVLRESEERYRNAIMAAGLVPYVVDYPGKRFSFIGENIVKFTGYTAEEITPALLRDSIEEEYLWGANANLSATEARQLIISGVPLEWRQDMRIRIRTGENRWISDTSIELMDEHGKAIGAIGIFQDITERKQAEFERETFIRELETRNAELEQVIQQRIQAEEEILLLNQQLQNQVAELERFTYTVSHDLRNPLVTIKGFLGSLEKDVQTGRQDRLQGDFQRISNAADKMQTLLSELLELSRIGRIANLPEEIELVKLTWEALETLDARLSASKVNVSIAPNLPVIHGDRVRLREVLENLIDNAAKYMGDQPNPQIEIGARNKSWEQIIFVKDNGMGIEPQYQTKIFGLFEKLNPLSEGTGIGLALVKRIIETHGGRIWVESEGLGKGSTFCFTIPDGRK